jgi:hypothetical protein
MAQRQVMDVPSGKGYLRITPQPNLGAGPPGGDGARQFTLSTTVYPSRDSLPLGRGVRRVLQRKSRVLGALARVRRALNRQNVSGAGRVRAKEGLAGQPRWRKRARPTHARMPEQDQVLKANATATAAASHTRRTEKKTWCTCTSVYDITIVSNTV